MKTNLLLTFAATVLFFSSAFATTHIIVFGPPVGFQYSPDTLNVMVGDTVVWKGDFSFHPMESTNVPFGATVFNISTGDSFSYQITAPGQYDYQCATHLFKGVLLATGTIGISDLQKPAMKIFPSATNGLVNVVLENPGIGQVLLYVVDERGQIELPIQEITDTRTQINLENLSAGIYFISVLKGDEVIGVERVVKN